MNANNNKSNKFKSKESRKKIAIFWSLFSNQNSASAVTYTSKITGRWDSYEMKYTWRYGNGPK